VSPRCSSHYITINKLICILLGFLLHVIDATKLKTMFTFIHLGKFAREDGDCALAELSPFDVQACATRSDFFPFILPSLLLILQFITPGYASAFARSAAVARIYTWHYLLLRAKELNQLLVSLASTMQGKMQMLHILAEFLIETFSSANARVPL
jgi:hypothetical protein